MAMDSRGRRKVVRFRCDAIMGSELCAPENADRPFKRRCVHNGILGVLSHDIASDADAELESHRVEGVDPDFAL